MNPLMEILGIRYPIIQGGMIWCSGWELASTVSNAGALGTIGSGSMYPDILEHHILQCKQVTDKPYAVNLPLIYPQVKDHIHLLIKHQVPVVITSAGSPAMFTKTLQDAGCKVLHVVSSAKFALKAQDAGCDAVIAEGFEAGGHNGREETTTMCLVPMVAEVVKIPVVAAGGISDGKSMLAAMTLGAQGVQMGSRFVLTTESSAHPSFKRAVMEAKEGETFLTLKEITPVRLLNNPFADQVRSAYQNGANVEELKSLLGRARAKKGMFEGDLVEGELEIGQVSARLDNLISAKDVVEATMLEFFGLREKVNQIIDSCA